MKLVSHSCLFSICHELFTKELNPPEDRPPTAHDYPKSITDIHAATSRIANAPLFAKLIHLANLEPTVSNLKKNEEFHDDRRMEHLEEFIEGRSLRPLSFLLQLLGFKTRIRKHARGDSIHGFVNLSMKPYVIGVVRKKKQKNDSYGFDHGILVKPADRVFDPGSGGNGTWKDYNNLDVYLDEQGFIWTQSLLVQPPPLRPTKRPR